MRLETQLLWCFVGVYDIWPWQTQQKKKKDLQLCKNFREVEILLNWLIKNRLYFSVHAITLPLALNLKKLGHYHS